MGKGRPLGSRNVFAQGDKNRVLKEFLTEHNFDFAARFMSALNNLNEPMHEIAALKVWAEIFYPKAIPDILDVESEQVNLDKEYDLYKRIVEAEVTKQCQQNGLQPQRELSPPSSPSELVTALSKQG